MTANQIILVLLSTPLIFFALWQAMNVVLSILHRACDYAPGAVVSAQTKVAILYTTCNDFRPEACDSLFAQEGVSCDVFVLDDSTNSVVKAAIDSWAESRTSHARVLRRDSRRAFKAGNINHWLASAYADPRQYPYFIVVDADERIPPDFVRRLLARIEVSGRAFVQACHRGTAEMRTAFQRLLHPQVECIWFYSVPARQAIGMPNALGHGILFRTDIIQKAGGFPEIVSEDLGLTICLAERGNTGEIATDIVGEEEYPTSYAAYWRRRCRWIQADAELLRIMSGQLAKSQIGLVAKMDLFLRELRLPLGSAYWALLMFAAVCAYWARDLGATLSPVAWIVLIVFLMPALVVLLIKRLTIVERLLYLFCMPFVGAATSAIHPVSTIRGLCKVQEFSSTGSSIRGVGHEKRFLTLWEVITGATVLLCGVLSWQWGLAAIGVAVLLSPFMRSKYEMPLLFVGVVAFWGLLGLQVIIDLFNGSMPMEHILLFSGIAITLE